MAYMYRRTAHGLAVALVVGAALPCSVSANLIYSGRAFGARVVIVNPQPNELFFSDTVELPSSGGSLSPTLLSVGCGNTLISRTVTASTVGAGNAANSSASQENAVAFPLQPAMTTASVVQAQAHADCNGLQGSSVVTNLAFGGSSVVVTGAPNQMTSIPGVATLVINEQIIDPSGTVITVNALPQPWNWREVIRSSARAGIECALPTQPRPWRAVKGLADTVHNRGGQARRVPVSSSGFPVRLRLSHLERLPQG
jgi:hypothetical protein